MAKLKSKTKIPPFSWIFFLWIFFLHFCLDFYFWIFFPPFFWTFSSRQKSLLIFPQIFWFRLRFSLISHEIFGSFPNLPVFFKIFQFFLKFSSFFFKTFPIFPQTFQLFSKLFQFFLRFSAIF